MGPDILSLDNLVTVKRLVAETLKIMAEKGMGQNFSRR
jgi:hypothetical protein